MIQVVDVRTLSPTVDILNPGFRWVANVLDQDDLYAFGHTQHQQQNATLYKRIGSKKYTAGYLIVTPIGRTISSIFWLF